jgi:hypothetical protein
VQREVGTEGSAVEEGVEGGNEDKPGLKNDCQLLDKAIMQSSHLLALYMLPQGNDLRFPGDISGRSNLRAITTSNFVGG